MTTIPARCYRVHYEAVGYLGWLQVNGDFVYDDAADPVILSNDGDFDHHETLDGEWIEDSSQA